SILLPHNNVVMCTNNWIDLQKQVMDSIEWRHEVHIRNIASTYGAFQQNAIELVKKLIWFEKSDEAISLMAIGNEDKMYAFWHDLRRLTSNYLSSISPLIEQTRALVKEFTSCGYAIQDYQKNVEKFRTDPILQFVQDLRNYTQHVVGIPLGSQLKYDIETGSHWFICLPLEELRGAYKWNPLAKQYLESQQDDPPLVQPILYYTQETEKLYRWLFPKIDETRTKEIEYLKKMNKEIQDGLKTNSG
ncbi:hypothetical protein, partial [Methanomassiliicoccus luminyensis]|uniref:hypothetical protein n=1 Tax=Methanomassiliicoccus luminyensis TaxID=1080712 RepID=UPI001F3F1425